MELRSVFAKRLKEARTTCGFSQRELGVEAGFDPSSASARMNQYERGKHIPDLNTVQRISDALTISPAYFFAIDDQLALHIWMFGRKSEKNVFNPVRGELEPLRERPDQIPKTLLSVKRQTTS